MTAAATTCPTAAAPVAVTDYAYDDLSRRTTVTLGNGTTISYGYSPQGTLASLGHDLASTAQDRSHTYERLGPSFDGFSIDFDSFNFQLRNALSGCGAF
ncbi:hypothetical protein [Azoarcus indigens]|uniref:YD repeat-containing protein n=1 Tax=Azoarcus indigens TaxID=29545 RepID=A0A4R6DBK6_9RHOO|nr:hypothetical protein [Azoarcus indigens]TDN41680.1 hypothetical protein C7389_1622 [Azoarcus indigens]